MFEAQLVGEILTTASCPSLFLEGLSPSLSPSLVLGSIVSLHPLYVRKDSLLSVHLHLWTS